jgi:phage shock protein PspC (stress-responsive transcriptional regulator)
MNTSGKKKFYRDPGNKILGGVCSGVAAYFGWDITWVRLATVLLFFLSFSIIQVTFIPGWLFILYIALWIAVPSARTAEQRLEMSGEPITVENIGKKVSEQAGTNTSNYERNTGCLSAFLKVCLIIFAIIIGIPALFVLVIVLIVLFAVLFGAGAGIFGGLIPGLCDNFLVVQRPVMAAIGGSLFIGIPLTSLIYTIISAIFKWKPLHKGIKITALIAWIMSIVFLLFSGWNVDWQQLRHWRNDNAPWFCNIDKVKRIDNIKVKIEKNSKVKGDGNIIEHTESFQGVVKVLDIKGYLDIDLVIDSLLGDSSGLTIEGDSNIINDYLYIEKSGDKLVLNTKKSNGWIKQTKQYKLLLRTSGLKIIDITGAANLETIGLNVNNIKVNASSAGHLKMSDISMTNLEIDCTGASNATLTGNVIKAKLDASGASNIQAYELTADTVFANATGASKIKCDPVVFLQADAAGVSNITYNSNSKLKSISTDTSGASTINAK